MCGKWGMRVCYLGSERASEQVRVGNGGCWMGWEVARERKRERETRDRASEREREVGGGG
jgi:hypothetical protein